MRKDEKRIVWGVSYTVRSSPQDKWSKDWSGPLGVYAFWSESSDVSSIMNVNFDDLDVFAKRPFFFRTRQQARDAIKHHKEEWWIKYRIDTYELSWKLLEEDRS